MRGIQFTSVLSIFLFSLSACDNGSNSNNRTSTTEPPSTPVDGTLTGQLVDSPVAGIAYATLTHKGVTSSDGRFQYEAGETVRFTLGDTLLGEVPGQSEVTPFDLAGSSILTGLNISWALEEEEHPFHRVINIAVLLQSLDDDADSQNGIEISAEVAALFHGVNLDLSEDWETFQDEPVLHHILGHASRNALFSQAHGVLRPATAAEQLYSALSIDPGTVGITRLQVLTDTNTSEERWQYDDKGNLTRHEVGILGYEAWQYDNNSNVTRHEQKGAGAFDSLDLIETWQYDSNGNVLRLEDDYDADGTPNRVLTYEHNADGNLTLSAGDYDLDGNNDWAERTQYHSNGEVKQYRNEQYDNGNLGLLDSWQYDINGNPVQHEQSFPGLPGGTFDQIETWAYDSNENPERYQRHANADGIPDETYSWHYEYDSNGNVLREEQFDDIRTLIIKTETWQYDPNGNATQHECSGNCPESLGWYSPDHVMELWQYHPNENVMLHTVDVSMDLGEFGRFASHSRYQYDERGHLTREERDNDTGGETGYIRSFEYDEGGNLTLYSLESFDGNRVIIAGNSSPGYDRGELFANGRALGSGDVRDIAFITYVNGTAPGEDSRDQGQIFDTGGRVDLSEDTLSQSITVGTSGRLTGVQIQLETNTVAQSNFSIFAGGNPPKGEALYSEEITFDRSQNVLGLFTWDLSNADLSFTAGDQFTLVMSTISFETFPSEYERYRFEYDASGNVTRKERLGAQSAMPTKIEIWQYDAQGNLARHELDDNGDGAIEETIIYDYAATGWQHLFSGIGGGLGHPFAPPADPRPDQGDFE